MVAFYRVARVARWPSSPHVVSVYVGDQMINFHRPATWRREEFTLRAPAARPPCGDLCFVWDGTPAVAARAARRRGRRDRSKARWRDKAVAARDASSVYVRDPDGNLLEFMIYP